MANAKLPKTQRLYQRMLEKDKKDMLLESRKGTFRNRKITNKGAFSERFKEMAVDSVSGSSSSLSLSNRQKSRESKRSTKNLMSIGKEGRGSNMEIINEQMNETGGVSVHGYAHKRKNLGYNHLQRDKSVMSMNSDLES